ncbi:MAG: ABC transporter substrate-binding protein [Lautropia sp.]|nr:ABC transporter substrate-binding protein [Lautropia sp.]
MTFIGPLPARRTLLHVSLSLALGALLPAGALADTAAKTAAQTLEVVAPWEINGLQPVTSGFLFQRMQVLETLVDVDHEGRMIGGLASSWQVSDDGLHWQFRLRENARFHDGSPVTAGRVLPSLKAGRKEPALLSLAPVDRIEAEGEHTVSIRLKEPYGALPALLAHSSTGIVSPESFDAQGKVTKLVATGPFEIEKVVPPQQLTVKRFEQYHGTKPEVARVHYLAAGRAETRALMAESGQSDLAFTVDPASLQRIRQRGQLQVVQAILPRTTILKLNAGLPALKDARVRQALSLAIDRKGVATALLRDPEMAATQLFPATMPQWHVPGLTPLGFDLAAAERLLTEAGWKKGEDGVLRNAQGEAMHLTLLTFPDRPELPQIATALQAQWKKLGVAVKVNIGNSGDIPLAHRDGSLQVGLTARNYGTVPDPIGSVAQDFSPKGGDWGAMNWHDAGMDKAIAALSTGTLPGAEAEAARKQVSTTLHEQLPVIPVSWYRQQVVAGRRIDNVSIDAFERSYRLTDIRWRQ